jgi:hypothetical protein
MTVGMKPDKLGILNFLDSYRSGYTDLKFPDEARTPSACGEIDATFFMNGERFALEHTRVVRFEGEYRSVQQFIEMRNELERRAPNVSHCVDVFIPFRDYGNAKQRKGIIDCIINQLPQALATMGDENSMYLPIEQQPWKAWIYRDPKEKTGLRFLQFNPDGKDQFPKLTEHIYKKLSKLIPYKTAGFKTLLLLETRLGGDSFLTSRAFLSFERKTGKQIDEVWEYSPKRGDRSEECTSYELDSYRRISNP